VGIKHYQAYLVDEENLALLLVHTLDPDVTPDELYITMRKI
jgi:hypothetical protein